MSKIEKINKGINYSSASVIEIGALDKPLSPRDAAQVFYVDHIDTPALKRKYEKDAAVDIERIVHVGGVWGKQALAEAAHAVAPVDFILASHVIEHVPDLITWFKEFDSVLKPGGEVRLVVPDKRYCFDFARRETNIVDVLAAYVVKARVPQPQQTIDFQLHARTADCVRIWEGTLDGFESKRFCRDQEALDVAYDVVVNGTYHDVHCWVFTPLSFAKLMLRLVELNLLEFGCSDFEDTELHTLEFFCFLRKMYSAQEAARTWEQLIEKIERSEAPKVKESDHVTELNERISQLLRDLDAAGREVEAANQKINAMKKEIQAIRSTISWKVTEPLRFLRRLVNFMKKE